MSSSGGPIVVFKCPPSPPPTPAPPEASLTTQERLKLARKRRSAQLKRWLQREREKPSSVMRPDVIPRSEHLDYGMGSGHPRAITFVANVMLLEAAARNDVAEVRRLLESGISPDSTNEDGLTALHQCCIDDSEEMMNLLLDYGGNPNATDTEKWTPLHAAATCGHLHLVKFLIDHGANLLAVNADGNMPYDLCEDDTTLSYIENEMAKRGVTQELIDETRAETERRMLRDLQAQASIDGGECLELRDPSGATPLHVASANGYLSVIEFLLDNHVATDVVDNDLWQPMHAAACWGHLEAVEALAVNGADISAMTRNGETPFDICEDPEIKDRLLQLREQRRNKLEQPRVKRSRSTSTRTQSIRRTSLREKMNTTKKDVQEEKMLFMQNFDSIPTHDQDAESDVSPMVDIDDVEIMFNNSSSPQNSNTTAKDSRLLQQHNMSSINNSSSNQQQLSNSNSSGKVASINRRKLPNDPKARVNSNDDMASNINVHVSVTINTPENGGPGSSSSSTAGLPKMSSETRNPNNISQISTSSPNPKNLMMHPSSRVRIENSNSPANMSPNIQGTTLSDLKRARSKSRQVGGGVSVSNSSSVTDLNDFSATNLYPSQSNQKSPHNNPYQQPDVKMSPMGSGPHHHAQDSPNLLRGPQIQQPQPPPPQPQERRKKNKNHNNHNHHHSNNENSSRTTKHVFTEKKCCTLM